jgi:hypothetical protein
MNIDYDELDKPKGKELVILWFYRSIPYIIGIVVLCVTVVAACCLAAKVENHSARDPWLNAARAYSHNPKTSNTRQ